MRSAPSSAPTSARAQKIVYRPEPLDPGEDGGPPALDLTPGPRPPTFWQEHAFFARYPRVLGALLSGVGGFLLYITLRAVVQGQDLPKVTVIAPVSATVGLWCLLFGCPLRRNGTPPDWWSLGFFSCIGLGILGSILLRIAFAPDL